MALDHGLLNLPLHKRGNFHKELDDHLKAQRKKKAQDWSDAKAAYKEAHKQALSKYELIDIQLLNAEAKRRGMRPSELNDVVRSLCNDRPLAAIKVIELFVKVA